MERETKMEIDPEKPWQDAVIEFLANPMDNRTDTKFCSDTGIHRSTYYEFIKKNRKELFAEVDRRRKEYLSEMRQKFYKALGSRMTRSDRITQLVGEMLGEYIPKSEQKVEYHTPEQKKERAKKLLEDIVKKVNSNNPPKQESGG